MLGCEGHPEDIYELVNTGGALHALKLSAFLEPLSSKGANVLCEISS